MTSAASNFKLFFILIFAQICLSDARTTTKKPGKVPSANSGKLTPLEKQIILRIRTAPRSVLLRAKTDAAKKLQMNVIEVFEAVATSNDPEIPANLHQNYQKALTAMQNGKLTIAFINALPTIIQEATPFQEIGASQLQGILRAMIPHAASNKQPLQAILDSVIANLKGTNNLLAKLLGGVPDLLAGVVRSLVNNLGVVTDTVNGSVGGIGPLVGTLLGAAG